MPGKDGSDYQGNGLMELLSYLEEKKIPAAVATSTRQSRGEKVLQMSGIAEYFAAFIYGDTQKASKPKPDIFWNAAKAIGRDPKECLVVEDSTPGVWRIWGRSLSGWKM